MLLAIIATLAFITLSSSFVYATTFAPTDKHYMLAEHIAFGSTLVLIMTGVVALLS